MPLPFALCAYSLPHYLGYLPTRSGEKCASPLGPLDLIRASKEFGLAGVEMPLTARVPSFDGKVAEIADTPVDYGAESRKLGLQIVADYGALLDSDAAHLKDALTTASKAGAKVMRAVLSHILCGDRRKLEGGWNAHRDALAVRLNEVLPHAESCGVCLAVENHQDATSDDLLWLADCVKQHPFFGVTLDTGNPLAVGEGVVEYTERIAPLIRHIHMKDYTIHYAPEGYRLVRCAAGDGVVDFPTVLEIVRGNGHDVLPAIEIAAQATRTIPFLEADWWTHYPPSQSAYLVEALRVLWAKGKLAHEPYSSAWERGENSETVCEEEWDIVQRSVNYFASITAQAGE